MLFSSLVFLYVFLPVVLLLILVSGKRWHNLILLFASLFFYAWGGVSYTLILIVSILLNYITGLLIEKYKGLPQARIALATGIGMNLLLLSVFKYANFLVDNINALLEPLGAQTVSLAPVQLALGISFFTFQAISYIVDVYEGRTRVQKKLQDLALYISLFPQLIAGPIVRYQDIAHQLSRRQINVKQFSYGLERFLLGLGKKVLLANNFALVADEVFAVNPENLSMPAAWFGLFCYTLQIYFDFSGYSDMAIGLGHLFGFRIPENFNFPYIARSIREFWRRWHISLSQWFRDYLYFPLGGNRMSVRRTYLNLIVVFFLTGLWHGASWNFVFWGLFHGLFMVLERMGWERVLRRIWWPLANFYTLMVVMISWVFFRADNFSYAWAFCIRLFSFSPFDSAHFDIGFYLNYELGAALLIGVLASTPLFRKMKQKLDEQLLPKYPLADGIYWIVTSVALIVLFFFCTMNLATNAYNPFIYFRF